MLFKVLKTQVALSCIDYYCNEMPLRFELELTL